MESSDTSSEYDPEEVVPEEQFDPSQLPPYFYFRLHETLRVACTSGKDNWVESLLKSGADANVADKLDKEGKTALHCAILQGHFRIVEILLPKVSTQNQAAAVKYTKEKQQKLVQILKILQPRYAETASVVEPLPEKTEVPKVRPPDEKKIQQSVDELRMHSQILELQNANDATKCLLEDLKSHSTAKESENLEKMDRLAKELEREGSLRKETEKKADELAKNNTQKEQDIKMLEMQLDIERREKEDIKRLVSRDAKPKLELQVQNNHVNERKIPLANKHKSKSEISININILSNSSSLKDMDNETIYIDRAKDDLDVGTRRIPVTQLVKTWESMSGSPAD